jgi:hypothetical protein
MKISKPLGAPMDAHDKIKVLRDHLLSELEICSHNKRISNGTSFATLHEREATLYEIISILETGIVEERHIHHKKEVVIEKEYKIPSSQISKPVSVWGRIKGHILTRYIPGGKL